MRTKGMQTAVFLILSIVIIGSGTGLGVWLGDSYSVGFPMQILLVCVLTVILGFVVLINTKSYGTQDT